MNLKSNSEFKQLEAEAFIKEILTDMVYSGKIENVKKYYMDDVVGHSNGETFGIEDIKDRFSLLKDNAKKVQLVLEPVLLVDQFIIYSCKHEWVNKIDQDFHSMNVYAIYRMKNRKISELWVSFDSPVNLSYKNANQKFSDYMEPLKFNNKTKHDFLSKISLLEKNHLAEGLKLTKVERNCLYYYLNGFSSKETAIIMSISSRTVECHLAQIKGKFGCRTKQMLRSKIFSSS